VSQIHATISPGNSAPNIRAIAEFTLGRCPSGALIDVNERFFKNELTSPISLQNSGHHWLLVAGGKRCTFVSHPIKSVQPLESEGALRAAKRLAVHRLYLSFQRRPYIR
jgi:hypothetical protein